MRLFLLPLALAAVVACSNARKKDSAPLSADSPPQVEVPKQLPSAAQVSGALKLPDSSAGPADSGSASLAHPPDEGVDPNKALGWLKNGNARFLKGWVRRDGQRKADVKRASQSDERPHTIVVSCSDSRIPPEIVFDQKLGEIFVVRTLGEALDESVIGSVEYGIDHGARLIVVMGHTSCGAVNAAIKTLRGGDAGSPGLNRLLADIRPRIKSSFGKETADDGAAQSLANAKGAAADLISRSAIVRGAVEQGRVVIKSALYDLNSGAVTFE